MHTKKQKNDSTVSKTYIIEILGTGEAVF